ncbi:MAG: zinc-binding alcohol dehydrogenase family protein [Cyanothece sp. SIO1E1]|nr:zinc-binding alcohol dehydrogenase family protein [Cyanothece sp. SIO1E1]
MRTISICGNNVKNLIHTPSFVSHFTTSGISVNCGLIHTQNLTFDRQAPEHYDQVLVKVRAFSCNYRDKALILRAATHDGANRFSAVGSEFVAEVVDCGVGVRELRPGDRVIGNNAYPDSGVAGLLPGVATNHGSREYQIFHQAKLIKIPPEMPDAVAAAFSIGGQTTYSMIRRLQLQPGETVLVTAARSNTSLFAINALRHRDVKVYATTTSPQFTAQLQALGVKRVIPVILNDDEWIKPELVEEIQQEVGRFNCIFDPFFDLHIGKMMVALDVGGRYITCGLYDQYADVTGQDFQYRGMSINEILSVAMIRNLQIMGNCIGLKADLEQAIQDYVHGKLEVVIDSVFQGDQVKEFFERTYNAKDRFGKVVYQYD